MSGYLCEPDFEASWYLCEPDCKVSWYLCKLYYEVSGYLCEPVGLVRLRFQRSTAKHYSKKSGLIYSLKKDA